MSLTIGGTQAAILAVFVAIVLILALVFALIARRAGRAVLFERVKAVGYRLRPYWLASLVALLCGVVGASLLLLPYRGAAREVDETVRVVGGQFYWALSQQRVPAGSTVRFEVTSADVNHGFGLYHPDGYLLGNVQAMPGYVNELELTLAEPGTYLVSCLEFCGREHHVMARELEVTE